MAKKEKKEAGGRTYLEDVAGGGAWKLLPLADGRLWPPFLPQPRTRARARSRGNSANRARPCEMEFVLRHFRKWGPREQGTLLRG